MLVAAALRVLTLNTHLCGILRVLRLRYAAEKGSFAGHVHWTCEQLDYRLALTAVAFRISAKLLRILKLIPVLDQSGAAKRVDLEAGSLSAPVDDGDCVDVMLLEEEAAVNVVSILLELLLYEQLRLIEKHFGAE